MRIVLAVLVAATSLAAASVAGDGRAEAQAVAERPNVVVVMTDDQRADELGRMKAVQAELADHGVTFENAIASFPLCCPSRASFLTGQYAHNHGVWSNYWSEGGGYRAYDDAGSLPIALDDAGYETAMVGKYFNEYVGPKVPDGWDEWAGRTVGETQFDYSLNVNGTRVRYGSRPRAYQTDVVARRGAGFIERNAGEQPLFLWASFFAPHGETLPGEPRWNPRPAPRHRGRFANLELPKPPSFDERWVGDKPSFVRSGKRLTHAEISEFRWRYRSRQAALLSVDEAVARLVDALRDAGELENTLIVFVADNGWMLGEHRLRGKEVLYEEAIRVPLVMRGPGLPEGANYGGIVGNIDLAPTILDVTGVAPQREPDGVSLLALTEDPAAWAERDILLELRRGAGIRTPDWMYAEHRTRRGVERELYDLEADPFQLHSVHDDPAYAAVRSDLAHRLDELRDCAGTSCR
jgi:N-acetylglucosamine-6-sulfatase